MKGSNTHHAFDPDGDGFDPGDQCDAGSVLVPGVDDDLEGLLRPLVAWAAILGHDVRAVTLEVEELGVETHTVRISIAGT